MTCVITWCVAFLSASFCIVCIASSSTHFEINELIQQRKRIIVMRHNTSSLRTLYNNKPHKQTISFARPRAQGAVYIMRKGHTSRLKDVVQQSEVSFDEAVAQPVQKLPVQTSNIQKYGKKCIQISCAIGLLCAFLYYLQR